MKKAKRFLAVLLALVMVACCLPATGNNVKAEDTDSTETVYNAVTYFTANTDNSNTGVWRYQYRQLDTTIGKYVYADMTSTTNSSNTTQWVATNSNTAYIQTTVDSTYSSGKTVIHMQAHTQTIEPVLTFVAPKSGLISICATNGGVYTGATTDLARFSMLHNEETVLSEEGLDSSNNNSGNRILSEAFVCSVNEGDIIRFVIGRNKNSSLTDGVRFIPEITYMQEYATEFDAVTYYTANTTNSNTGVWRYQYRTKGTTTYNDMTHNGTNWVVSSTNSARIRTTTGNYADNGTVIEMKTFDQTTEPTLTFVAPWTGTISICATNGAVYTGATTDLVRFYVLHNEETILSEEKLDQSNNTSNKILAQPIQLSVTKGDTIRFIIGRNGNSDITNGVQFAPKVTYTEAYNTSFNAYEDYSTSANPNGVWTYATLKDGTYTNMSYDTSDLYWGTSSANLKDATSDKVTNNAAITVRPDNTSTDVVLAFTAPMSGKIEVSMANGGVFAPESTSGKGEIAFTFKHNDTVVKSIDALDASKNTSDSRFFTDTVELTVQEGDVLRFVVHRNTAVNQPRTYFNPAIQYTSLKDEPVGIDYYVSTDGSDNYAGTTSTSPWKTLAKLKDIPLDDNDRILLKAGDTFTEQLVLNNVHGTEDYPAVISSYGEGDKPVISYTVSEDESTIALETAVPSILLNDVEYLEIDGLSIKGSEEGTAARVGLHLAYNNTFNNQYVKIQNCTFTDLTGFDIRDYRGTSERSKTDGVGENITGVYQMATAITASVNNYNIGVDDPALIGLYIEQCETNNCGTLFAPAASVDATNEGGSKIVHGLYVTDCTMTNNDYYGIYVSSVQGGYISGCTIDGCGAADEFAPGTAGVLLSTKDFALISTEIKNQQRGGCSYDGVAVDFEHLCDNVIMKNNYIHGNTGAGVFFYDSGAGSTHANVNCQVVDNVFYNNASEATGTSLRDDPFADIRITSETGHAAKNCTITNNYYYNELNKTLLSYSFVNDAQKVGGNITIDDNVNEKKEAFLNSNKEEVLASIDELFGDYNKSSYKFNVRKGQTSPFSTILEDETVEFAFATTFTTSLESVKALWNPLQYLGGTFTEMTWNSTTSKWVDSTGAAHIDGTSMHPAAQGQTILEFVAPQTGRVCISMTDVLRNGLNDATVEDGTYITILNDNKENIAEPVWLKAGNEFAFTPVYTSVTKGESIYICLSKCAGNQHDNTAIKPVISYVYNDVNGDTDNTLNVCDIVRMKKMILEDKTVDTTVADYNGNKSVDDSDISAVRQYCLNWWDAYSEQ